MSVTSTADAPKAFAVKRHMIPTGPAPQTKTLLPRVTPPLRHACTATDSGSMSAPSSSVTPPGNLWQKAAGCAKRRLRVAGTR